MTVHVGTLLSVYLRHGAMLIAIAVCWVVVPFICGIMLGVFGMILRGTGSDGAEFLMRYLLPVGLMTGQVVVCVLIHRLILYRVEELAAK